MTDKAADIARMSFEDALAELERIVATLEKGQAPLEESIRLYERGEAIKKHCDAQLKSAESRIEKITLGADGSAKGVEPLDSE